MALKIPHCARCSGACELKTLPSVSGEDGPLKLTVLDMPVLACAKTHKAPVHRDFMLWLIQQIRGREAQTAAGKEEGLLFKKHVCGACGKEQIRSAKELHGRVPLAMVGVSDGAGFPHSG